MKRVILLLLTLFTLIGGYAQSFSYTYNGVEFKGKISGGTACIKSFNNKATDVVIPAFIEYKGAKFPVKQVSTFMNGVNYLTVNLTLEEGIEDIDKFCFNEFRKLRTVKLPSTLRHIGKNAIRDNNLLSFSMLSSINESSIRRGDELYPTGEGMMVDSRPDMSQSNQQYLAQAQQKAEEQAKKDEMKALQERLKEQEKMLALMAQNEQKNNSSDDNKRSKGLGGLFSKGKKGNNSSETPSPELQLAASEATSPEFPPVDVDIDIPVVNTDKNRNTYCLIIANEKYADVPEVEFAERDGAVFKEYCVKTLGIPEKQIKMFANASYTDIKRGLNWIETMAEISNGNSKVVFYYAGHGIPNEKDKTAYLIPTDGFPKDITTCFKLSDIYSRLGKLNTENVTVLLDACFSGVKRGSGQALVAARGVAIKPKDEVLSGNMVVFTAASDDETALAYQEKRHGMFTYFLLDKLKKSSGNMAFGDLFNELSQEVKKNSMLENDKLQTPSVNVSASLKAKWSTMKF